MCGTNLCKLRSLEKEAILDRLNDIDLFCVHFAVLLEVNCCLREFFDVGTTTVSTVRTT